MPNVFLLITVLFPAVAGVILKCTGKEDRRFIRIYAFAVSVLTSVLVWSLILWGDGEMLPIFRVTERFIFAFKLDGLGKFFSGIVSALWPLTVLYAMEYMEEDEHQNSFFAFFLMAYGATLGVAMSGSMFTLYCFYELLTLSTVPLVMHEESITAVRAARTYFFVSLGGAAFAFLSILYPAYVGDTITANRMTELFFLFGFFGFGVKAAVFPLHFWLPRAGVAPTPVTALLHAVAVVKSGVFAIVRLVYFWYGADLLRGTMAQKIALCAAIFTIFFGAARAVKETHFKRRLAYSTVANLSYILFGVLLMNTDGLRAGLLHMAFHAEIKILAFFAAGAVIHHTHRNYIFEMDGLGRKMPFTFVCYLVSALGLTGIPPFSGFVSKWMLLTAAVKTGTGLSIFGGAVLVFSALLTAFYSLTVVRRAFFPDKEKLLSFTARDKEAGPLMLVPMGLIAVGILVTGLCAGWILSILDQILVTIV